MWNNGLFLAPQKKLVYSETPKRSKMRARPETGRFRFSGTSSIDPTWCQAKGVISKGAMGETSYAM